MEAKIDKDEWMDVWNSNTELRAQVMALQEKVEWLDQRLIALEEPVTMYGKEVKRR